MSQSYNQPHGQPKHSSGGGFRQPAETSRIDAALLAKIDFNSLTSEIFSGIAEKAAKLVRGDDRNHKNKRTQLRRFYDELVMWDERVQQEQGHEKRSDKYKELEPFIKMLKAKVVYAKGREHVDETFVALFSHCIGRIGSPESLKHCQLFMEAFMGYYRALDEKSAS